MGICSTKYVSRQYAINRITLIDWLISMKRYKDLRDMTGEWDIDLESYVDSISPLDLQNKDFEQWTDTMLESKLDQPFYRESMFYDYLIDYIDEF